MADKACSLMLSWEEFGCYFKCGLKQSVTAGAGQHFKKVKTK